MLDLSDPYSNLGVLLKPSSKKGKSILDIGFICQTTWVSDYQKKKKLEVLGGGIHKRSV